MSNYLYTVASSVASYIASSVASYVVGYTVATLHVHGKVAVGYKYS